MIVGLWKSYGFFIANFIGGFLVFQTTEFSILEVGAYCGSNSDTECNIRPKCPSTNQPNKTQSRVMSLVTKPARIVLRLG